MNCDDFNKIVTELADDQLMPATLRNAGVSHAAFCSDCARKLAAARAVSGALLTAAAAEIEAAPLSVKSNLIAALAAQTRVAGAPAEIVNIADRRKLRWPIA